MSSVIMQLRGIRKKKKLSLKEVSEKATVSVPYLSEVERALTNPSLHILERILAVYGKELIIVPEGFSQVVFTKLKILLDSWDRSA